MYLYIFIDRINDHVLTAYSGRIGESMINHKWKLFGWRILFWYQQTAAH